MIVALALRNIRRHLRRSLLTIAAIGVGSALTLISDGLSLGGHEQMIENGVMLGQGHLTVQREGYREAPEPGLTVAEPGALAARLRRDPDVREVFVRLRGEGMLASARGAEGVAFTAIDPAEPGESRLLRTAMKGGSFLADASASEAVIGATLAGRLGVKPGSKAVFTFQDARGEITSVLFRVRGVFRTGSPAIDAGYVVLPLAAMQRALAVGDSAHSLAILLRDPARQARVAARWEGKLPPGTVLMPWQALQTDLRDYVVLDDLFGYLIYLIILLIVTVGVLNTVLMSVMERQHEFGILLALGMRPARILLMVLAETAAIGVLGLALGTALGLSVHGWFHVHGLDLSTLTSTKWELAGTVVDTVIYSQVRPDRMALLWGTVFLLTMAMGLYPAWKAARLHPVEAIGKT